MGKKSLRISPFANESESAEIGGLTIENRVDRISFYGSIDITRDIAGLAKAEALKALFDEILTALKAEHLPDKISVKPAEEVHNPFADTKDNS